MKNRDFEQDSDDRVWYLIPTQPATIVDSVVSFRRWNIVIISILGMIILGLFLVALVPQGSDGSAASRVPRAARK